MATSQDGEGRDEGGCRNVFTYGTLMIPEILTALTGKSFLSVSAVLEGTIRLTVKGRPYPGIMDKIGTHTDGRLYRGVDRQSIDILDRFEGMLYERQARLVRTADQQEQYGEVYIVKKDQEHALSRQPWNLQWFKNEWLEAYLRSCEEFRVQLLGR